MFQVPVENVEGIRSMRPWVKGVLGRVGLDVCKDLLKSLEDFDPGEQCFQQTLWRVMAPWEGSGNKVKYRSKPYCCSLCTYSATALGSFRNHVRRHHADEAERELLVSCPDCPFASTRHVVDSHFRWFHQPAGESARMQDQTWSREFTCLLCSSSMTSFRRVKEHVLMVHFPDLLGAFVGFGAEGPLEVHGDAPDRYFCRECGAGARSLQALVAHVVTASAHKDLENELKSVILERRTRFRGKQMTVAPKPAVRVVTPPNHEASAEAMSGPPCSPLTLPQICQSLALGQPLTSTQPVTSAPMQLLMEAQPVTSAPIQLLMEAQPVTSAPMQLLMEAQPVTSAPIQLLMEAQPVTSAPMQLLMEAQPVTSAPMQLLMEAQPVTSAPMQLLMEAQPVTSAPMQLLMEAQPVTSAPMQLLMEAQPVTSAQMPLLMEAQPVTSAPMQPLMEAQPVTSALMQPLMEAQPVTSAPMQPLMEAQPVTSALMQPLMEAQPVTSALVQPLTGTQPVTPALVQSVSEAQPMTTLIQPLTGAPVQPVTGAQPVSPALVQPLTSTPGTSWSFTGSMQAATHFNMAVVSCPLPVGQTSLTLQPSAPQPIFLTGRAPPNQLLNTLVPSQQLEPVSKSVGMRVEPGALPLTQPMGHTSTSVRPGILPVGPPVSSGGPQAASPRGTPEGQVISWTVIPVGQMTPGAMIPGQTVTSREISTGQLVQSGALQVGQAASSQAVPTGQIVPFWALPEGQVVVPSGLPSSQPAVLDGVPVNQDVSSGIQCGQLMASGVVPVGQPARPSGLQLFQCVSNSTLPGSQPVGPGTGQNTIFLPSGVQMNGKPIYLLDPMSVTLPVLLDAGLEVSSQVVSSDVGTQMINSVPSLPSQQGLSSTADPGVSVQDTSAVDVNPVCRQAKHWSVCPVGNAFFPSNSYQVHMSMAHKQSESNSNENHEPEKLAVYAPFVKWVREEMVRCLSCERSLSEEELMDHLLMHGLGCPFCLCTFHDIGGLLEHSRTKHLGQKRRALHYSNRGFQLTLDAEGNLLFPHFDFITTLPRERLGEQEACLAILARGGSEEQVSLYVHVRPQPEVVPKVSSKQKLTCPFNCGTFTMAEAYNLHLKEWHHVMVWKTLGSSAFKCVHCFKVYTVDLTLAAITAHLLHCRSAPLNCSSLLQVQPGFVESRELHLVNGEVSPGSAFPVKRKLLDPDPHVGWEYQKLGEEPSLVLKAHKVLGPEEDTSAVPLKRPRNESMTVGLGTSDDLLQVLVLDPSKYKGQSREQKKQFLKDYFHKKPYPGRKEIELLSFLLQGYKINVANFFGKRRRTCMKAMKIHKPSVLLGFDMSELRNVKHRLNFEYEPQK